MSLSYSRTSLSTIILKFLLIVTILSNSFIFHVSQNEQIIICTWKKENNRSTETKQFISQYLTSRMTKNRVLKILLFHINTCHKIKGCHKNLLLLCIKTHKMQQYSTMLLYRQENVDMFYSGFTTLCCFQKTKCKKLTKYKYLNTFDVHLCQILTHCQWMKLTLER